MLSWTLNRSVENCGCEHSKLIYLIYLLIHWLALEDKFAKCSFCKIQATAVSFRPGVFCEVVSIYPLLHWPICTRKYDLYSDHRSCINYHNKLSFGQKNQLFNLKVFFDLLQNIFCVRSCALASLPPVHSAALCSHGIFAILQFTSMKICMTIN